MGCLPRDHRHVCFGKPMPIRVRSALLRHLEPGATARERERETFRAEQLLGWLGGVPVRESRCVRTWRTA